MIYVLRSILSVCGALCCALAFAQAAPSDKPCGIGEVVLDKAVPGQVLITVPGRFHWKYSGSLAEGNISIMLGEGFVYRFVQDADKMTSTNIGRYLSVKDGETIKLDQGAVNCVIKPSLVGSEPVLEVQLTMEFTRPAQRASYRLPVSQ